MNLPELEPDTWNRPVVRAALGAATPMSLSELLPASESDEESAPQKPPLSFDITAQILF